MRREPDKKERTVSRAGEEANPGARHQKKMAYKTQAASPNKVGTSRDGALHVDSWKQLLQGSKQQASSKIRMFPQDYVDLFKQKEESEKRSIRRYSRLGRPTQPSYKPDLMGKVYQKMQKCLDKCEVPRTCKQILGTIQNARRLRISEERLVKLIRRCTPNNTVVKLILNFTKYHENARIVKTQVQLMEKVKKAYMTSPEGEYVVVYLKEFRDNLQRKVDELDDRMVKAIERCVEKWNSYMQKEQRFYNQQNTNPKASNKRSSTPQLNSKSSSPKTSFILNKLRLIQLNYGQEMQISSFSRNRYQELERIHEVLRESKTMTQQ